MGKVNGKEELKNALSIVPEVVSPTSDSSVPETVPEALPPVTEVHHTTGMRCDFCSISATCPEFSVGSDCTVDFNALFRERGRTSDALNESIWSVLEMQYQRIQRGVFQEKNNFGTLDPNVTEQLLTYMRLAKEAKKLSEDNNTVKIEATGKAGTGLLRSLLNPGAEKNT